MAVFCKPSDKGQLIIHKNRSFNFSLDSKSGNLERALKRAVTKREGYKMKAFPEQKEQINSVKLTLDKEFILKVFILKVLRDLNKETYKINRIGLFGSFANGNQTSESDIDVFVEFEDDANVFRNFYDLKYDLEETLEREIDLISSDNFDYNYKNEEVKEYKDKVKNEILKSVIYV